MNVVLTVKNVRKYYETKGNRTKALDDISFEVSEGDYIGIMGASGSGKTTLLNCISTIDTVTGGHIYIRGRDITQMDRHALAQFRREELGFIFQDFNLLDTLSGRDNIALSLAITGENPEVTEQKVEHIAAELGITEILDKYPYEISGGQKQRIACARAMATAPSLVLADEPTGALDSKSAGMLLDSFRIMNERKKATILMVTHDAFTASHCRCIFFIKDGKIFDKLVRGSDSRMDFFEKIINVVSLLGGDSAYVKKSL